jgi:hypothetical protein
MDGRRNRRKERYGWLGAWGVLALVILLPSGCSGGDAGISKKIEEPLFGFAVSKPNLWRHITAEESRARISSNKLKDESMEVLVRLFASRPIVVMMKARKHIPLPSFTVTVNPMDSDLGTSATEILRGVSRRAPNVFPDYSIVTGPAAIQIDGRQAAYMRAHYSGQFYDDNKAYPISYETWIVPREEYFFMICVASSQDEDEETRGEIVSIIKSIELED